MPKQIGKEKEKFILGAQAQLWTEYVATPEHAEYMMFPRLLAFAEAVWSPAGGPELRRLPAPVAVSARSPRQAGRALPHSRTRGTEGFLHDLAGSRGRRSEPDLSCRANVLHARWQRADRRLDALSWRPCRSRFGPNNRNCSNSSLLPRRAGVASSTARRFCAVPTWSRTRDEAQPKLAFVLYNGKFASVRDIERGAKVSSGTTESLDLQQFGRSLNFAVKFEGSLKIEIQMSSTSSSWIRTTGQCSRSTMKWWSTMTAITRRERSPGIFLCGAGMHKFRLRYFQAEGRFLSLGVSWAAADGELQPLAGAALFHQPDRPAVIVRPSDRHGLPPTPSRYRPRAHEESPL